MQTPLSPQKLAPLDIYTEDFPLLIDLVYAGKNNFMGEAIYKPDARLWLQEDLTGVVLLAATIARNHFDCGMVLYDGLRTTTAQQVMLETQTVKDNPHWLAGSNRVLSPPGKGGHPRGWAIDLSLIDEYGHPVPMGTAFDELPLAGSGPHVNRAHRQYMDLPSDIKENRKILEHCMTEAAEVLSVPLLPLPVEWWDFRIPPSVADHYKPFADEDLPVSYRMTDLQLPDDPQGAQKYQEDHVLSMHHERQRRQLTDRIMHLYKTAYSVPQEL